MISKRFDRISYLYLSILFLSLILISISPFKYHMLDYHWLGSEAAYSYWLDKKFLWGEDVIQNIGPLGFINYPLSFTGINDYSKISFNILLSAYLVVATIFVAKKINNFVASSSFLFIFILIQISKDAEINSFLYFSISSELNHYLIALFAIYFLFYSKNVYAIISTLFILALLSLGKSTFLVTTFFSLILTSISYLLQKNYRNFFLLIFLFPIFFTLLWFFSNQTLSNLDDFFIANYHFIQGYVGGLSNLPEKNYYPFLNFFQLILLGSVILSKFFFNFYKSLNRSSLFILILIEGFFAFVIYKYAVVAEDRFHIHVFRGFTIATIIPFYFMNLENNKNISLEPKKISYILIFFFIILFFSNTFQRNFKFLFNLNSNMISLSSVHQQHVDQMKLEKIKSIVKNDTVSYWGELPSPMIYNNFNYITHPSTISFAGNNKYLTDKDFDFFNNVETSPNYLILHLYNAVGAEGAIAKQFSALNGVRTQLAIINNYDVVLDNNQPIIENGRLLLKKNNFQNKNILFKSVKSLNVSSDKWFEVDLDTKTPIIAKIKIDNRMLSKVFNLFYKPPIYFIEIFFENDLKIKERFTPFKGEEGILVQPFINSNADFINSISNQEWKKFVNDNSTRILKTKKIRLICNGFSFTCARNANIVLQEVNGVNFGFNNSLLLN